MNKYIFIVPLAVIVVVINFSVSNSLLVFDVHRIAQISLSICLLLYACCFIPGVFGLGYVRWRRQGLLVRGFVFIGLVFSVFSVMLSPYPVVAVKGMVNDLILLLSAFILSICSVSHRRFVFLSIAYAGLIGLGLYYFQFFVGFFAGLLESTSIEREVLVHHFSNIRFLNQLQVLFFPFLIVLSVSSRKWFVSCAAMVVSTLTIAILFYLSARAGFGSLCIGAVVLFTFFKSYRGYIKRFLLVLLSGGVFYLVILKGLPLIWVGEVSPVRVNLNSSGRWEMWLEVFDLLKEEWLFGVGGLHYSLLSSYGFAHPHNIVLQIGLEYGVFVLVMLTLLAIKFGFSVCSKLQSNDSDTIMGLFPFVWSLTAIAGVSMFSGVWVAPLTQLVVVICIAPVFALFFEGNTDSLLGLMDRDKVRLLFIRGILIVAALTLLVLVFPDIKLRSQGNVSAMHIKGAQVYAPRFWQEDVWPEK